jgi:putative selenate reductase molybdopterin-binding subunit
LDSISRAQHAHLETHCSITWLDDRNRLNVRTSSQTPFLTQAKLCYLLGLPSQSVRVFCERVGGGFGAKQEAITEDICALATLRTGKPVKLEYTREEEFGATTRHPMKLHVKAGASPDGTLTALQIRYVSNTGAYGSHGATTLFHSTGESGALYRCPNKRIDAYAVYTNTVPAGAFRGYGLSQTVFAVEVAMHELARGLKMNPFEFLRRNVIRRHRWPTGRIRTVLTQHRNAKITAPRESPKHFRAAPMQGFADAVLQAQCIATDDPRLKGE